MTDQAATSAARAIRISGKPALPVLRPPAALPTPGRECSRRGGLAGAPRRARIGVRPSQTIPWAGIGYRITHVGFQSRKRRLHRERESLRKLQTSATGQLYTRAPSPPIPTSWNDYSKKPPLARSGFRLDENPRLTSQWSLRMVAQDDRNRVVRLLVAYCHRRCYMF